MSQFDRRDFQCAFAAVSYLLGRRDGELLEPFTTPQVEARALQSGLAQAERERRAEALARELSRLARALSARFIQ